MMEQLELPLSAPPSFEELIARKKLKRLQVSVHRRLRRRWHVTVQPFTRQRHLHVPAYLDTAPRQVKEALLSWARLPDPRRSVHGREIRRQKRALEAVVWNYVQTCCPDHANGKRVDPKRFETGTQGTSYDLREVFNHINARYFNSEVQSSVRWGRAASITSYQTRRRAPDGTEYNLITIAGAYNHPSVPRFAIEGILYHEMLHIVVPPRMGAHRRQVHGRAFRQAERQFSHFQQWHEWQGTHIRRIARTMRRAIRS